MRVRTTDLYNIKTLSRPVPTAAGVVFNENWIDQEHNDYRSRLFSQNRATGERVSLGHDQQHDTAAALGPDGSTLAFLSHDQAGHQQVFTQAFTGGAATQRTWFADGVTGFHWQPDGEGWFVQVTVQHPQQPTDWLHATRVTRLHYQDNGPWLLDERRRFLLYKQGWAQANHELLYQDDTEYTVAAVSPQGQLAIDHNVATDAPQRPADVVSLLTPGESTPVRVETGMEYGSFGAVAFSPDGQKLLLAGNPNEDTGWLSNTLFVVDCQSGAVRRLFDDEDVEIGAALAADTQQNLSGRVAAWTGDDQISYVASSRGCVELHTTDLDGHGRVVVGGRQHVTDFAFTDDGQGVYYTQSTITTPSQLYFKEVESADSTLLYDPNTTWSQEHTTVAPDDFSFERNGRTLQGWYYRPVGVVKGTAHPAVLYIHGGPHAAYGETFYHELQVLANAGYGVITLNPRGGATYGNAFAHDVLADYGNNDYEDLMQAVDEAEHLDTDIDDTHVYATGGSYGGFMSNWIETHTARFRAVATCRSISNWVSMFGTSDIGWDFLPINLDDQWESGLENADRWWQFSPLKYVDQAQSPILILHGEEDRRCPIEQGEQFYNALKLKGVETEFVRFPKSNHELSRSGLPNLRIERMEAIMEWFQRHA